LTLLYGAFNPQKPVPYMTYNVFGGTLNLGLLNQASKTGDSPLSSLPRPIDTGTVAYTGEQL